MKTVVLEPQTEYKVLRWFPSIDVHPIDENILNIENSTITCSPPSVAVAQFSLGIRKVKKLSSLRGKMTKQNEREIDDQIFQLRSEWERDI
ncbi:MAG: hypothetical protein ACKO96_36405 [Flammeovirgaceae bacterium]